MSRPCRMQPAAPPTWPALPRCAPCRRRHLSCLLPLPRGERKKVSRLPIARFFERRFGLHQFRLLGLVLEATEIAHHTDRAQRLARDAGITPVQDQPMMGVQLV